MTKITTEIDGKKYELMPEHIGCVGCALFTERKIFLGCSDYPKFNSRAICAKLHGVWKEIKDED